MAKVLYAASMSLDGFIAGPGGDMSWLTEYFGPNPLITDLIGDIGALLVGRTSYDGDDPHKLDDGAGKPFGGGWHGPQYVVTHRPPAETVPGVHFVDDLATALARAKAAAGDKYVNVIGADIARQLLERGEVDEILTAVVPILLGGGTPLFRGDRVKLTRIHQSAVPQATNLWFRA